MNFAYHKYKSEMIMEPKQNLKVLHMAGIE